MSGGTFGGEDINALVFDIGTHSIRVGYAGDFEPKAVIPTIVGIREKIPDISKNVETNLDNVQLGVGKPKRSLIEESILEEEKPLENLDAPKPDEPKNNNNDENKENSMDTSDVTAAKPTETKPEENTSTKYLTGANCLNSLLNDVEIKYPVHGGVIQDFDLLKPLLDHAYATLKLNPQDHPVLLTESAWNTKEAREQTAKLFFEHYKVPAFQIIKAPVLALFSQNRHSGLVIDIGHAYTSVVPVYEGNIVKQAITRSPFAGQFLTDRCKEWLNRKEEWAYIDHSNMIPLVLPYQIKSKKPIMDGKSPEYVKRDLSNATPTQSWRVYHETQQYEDFKRHILQTSDRKLRETEARNYPSKHYEFPNGFHVDFGYYRFQLAEYLFEPGQIPGIQGNNAMLGLPNLIQQAARMCDADMRTQLFNNIMITGSGSLLPGLAERMNSEVQLSIGARTKVIQPSVHPMMNERKFSSWIGGSILGSLGAFHHMWITSEEWSQQGASVFDKKCVL